jgi:hypothetical protein
MNEFHLRYLASPEWAATLRDELLPWVLGSSDLGDDCLEVGPGPGVTTDLLRGRAVRLTAVELDPALAVLRPGATLLGSDSIESPEVRVGHDDDIFVPVDPDQLGGRLVAAGFEQPEVETKGTRVRFAVRKP